MSFGLMLHFDPVDFSSVGHSFSLGRQQQIGSLPLFDVQTEVVAVEFAADVLLVAGNNEFSFPVLFQQFLVVAAALERVATAQEVRHLVEHPQRPALGLIYLRLRLEAIACLWASRNTTYTRFSNCDHEPMFLLPSAPPSTPYSISLLSIHNLLYSHFIASYRPSHPKYSTYLCPSAPPRPAPAPGTPPARRLRTCRLFWAGGGSSGGSFG